MKTITVTFDNGKATIETTGFVGKECVTATLALEKALGSTTSDRLTTEGLRQPQQVNRVRQ